MIGYQHVGVHMHAKARRQFGQEAQELFVVSVLAKDIAPVKGLWTHTKADSIMMAGSRRCST